MIISCGESILVMMPARKAAVRTEAFEASLHCAGTVMHHCRQSNQRLNCQDSGLAICFALVKGLCDFFLCFLICKQLDASLQACLGRCALAAVSRLFLILQNSTIQLELAF